MGLLKLDLETLHSFPPSHGITAENNIQHAKQILEKFLKDMDANRSGFFHLPHTSHWAQELGNIQPLLAKRIPQVDTFLHIGIGGSSLGAEAIIKAVGSPKAPTFHFLDNIDPDSLYDILEVTDPARTLVYVVTKSGVTLETVATFIYVYQWLEKKLTKERARQHLVFCTDPQNGELRTLAKEWQVPTFSIPPSVGGRYSVLTAVGLFPALVAGVDCTALIKGAAQYREHILQERNEGRLPEVAALALLLAQYYQHDRRNITTLFSYSQKLRTLGAWFTQLWAESLGKQGKGLTPLAAVGATDQHSVLQLLRDGPQDKTVLFLEIQGFQKVLEVKWLHPSLNTFSLVSDVTINQLIDAELNATRQVLTNAKRPHGSIILPKLNALTLGQLLFMLETLTALTGYALEVDPFDQPGVEEGKNLTKVRIGACKKSVN